MNRQSNPVSPPMIKFQFQMPHIYKIGNRKAIQGYHRPGRLNFIPATPVFDKQLFSCTKFIFLKPHHSFRPVDQIHRMFYGIRSTSIFITDFQFNFIRVQPDLLVLNIRLPVFRCFPIPEIPECNRITHTTLRVDSSASYIPKFQFLIRTYLSLAQTVECISRAERNGNRFGNRTQFPAITFVFITQRNFKKLLMTEHSTIRLFVLMHKRPLSIYQFRTVQLIRYATIIIIQKITGSVRISRQKHQCIFNIGIQTFRRFILLFQPRIYFPYNFQGISLNHPASVCLHPDKQQIEIPFLLVLYCF